MVTLSYLPDDDRSGTFTGAISGSGVTGWASGAYKIAAEEGGPLTLT